MLKKDKAVKGKKETIKKPSKSIDEDLDTIAIQIPSKEPSKSAEAAKKEKERTLKDTRSKKKKTPSAPAAEKAAEKTAKEAISIPLILAAAKGFCKYLLDMKEASLSTYFDQHLAKYTPTNCTFVEWEKNISKNRSKCFKLIDSTRVVLDSSTPASDKEDGSETYINASHIKFSNTSSEFIITQYPLPHTINDFWRMVTSKNVTHIISIFSPNNDKSIEEFRKPPTSTVAHVVPSTTNVEFGCATSPGKSSARDAIMIRSRRCNVYQGSFFPMYVGYYINQDGWLINTRIKEPDQRNRDWMTTFTVEVVPDGCSEATFARVYNCSTWNWKQVPTEEKLLLALVRAPYSNNSSGLVPNYNKSHPIIVMCDLGLDRSATVVLTSIIIELILDGKTPDCDALFKKMRDQRAHVFTTSIFYTYAIRTALVYLKLKFQLLNDSAGLDMKKMIDNALEKVPFFSKNVK